MPLFRVYDLLIDAPDVPRHCVPFSSEGVHPDVFVSVAHTADPTTLSERVTREGDDILHLEDPEFGRVALSRGSHIAMELVPTIGTEEWQAALLGTLLSCCLLQRRRFPLHAASLLQDGAVGALCGPSGAGKSTLVSALARRGNLLVSDDVTPLELDGAGRVRASAGRREVKLDSPSARALGFEPNQLGVVPGTPEKRFVESLRDGQTVPAGPWPLAAVYLMEWGERLAIEPLDAQEAFTLFMQQGHRPTHFFEALGPAALMQWCAALARGTRAFRFVRPADFTQLDHSAVALEQHLQRLAQESREGLPH